MDAGSAHVSKEIWATILHIVRLLKKDLDFSMTEGGAACLF